MISRSMGAPVVRADAPFLVAIPIDWNINFASISQIFAAKEKLVADQSMRNV